MAARDFLGINICEFTIKFMNKFQYYCIINPQRIPKNDVFASFLRNKKILNKIYNTTLIKKTLTILLTKK